MSRKIALSEVLAAIDLDGKAVWDDLDAEQQKRDINFFTLNRYISSVQGSRDRQEFHVLVGNERYNKNLFAIMKKHPQLTWQTACSCSFDGENIQRHKWLGIKRETNKKVDFLAKLFPHKKMADLETLAAVTTTKDIKDYCEKLGWDKKQLKSIKF